MEEIFLNSVAGFKKLNETLYSTNHFVARFKDLNYVNIVWCVLLLPWVGISCLRCIGEGGTKIIFFRILSETPDSPPPPPAHFTQQCLISPQLGHQTMCIIYAKLPITSTLREGANSSKFLLDFQIRFYIT